nr:PREDICTED: metallophosphoesterase domain-containing protein 1-like [Equus przewalskii]
MELPGVKPVLRPFGLWPLPLPGPASPFWRPSLNHLLFPDRQPWFYGWGFNLPRGQALLEKWNLIPEGVDILITHGPPLGFLDWVPKKMQRVGCVELLNTVQRRVQPRLHVFGMSSATSMKDMVSWQTARPPT